MMNKAQAVVVILVSVALLINAIGDVIRSIQIAELRAAVAKQK